MHEAALVLRDGLPQCAAATFLNKAEGDSHEARVLRSDTSGTGYGHGGGGLQHYYDRPARHRDFWDQRRWPDRGKPTIPTASS
jgi:hypothetical protein